MKTASMKTNEAKMALKSPEFEDETKTAVGLGRFLTQKILRPDTIEKLIETRATEPALSG
jgi:hypothetical protein